MKLKCPYCKKPTKLVKGNVIYPHRPDLYDKNFCYCKDCNAWVGCHPGTDKPLGRLANAELRIAKFKVHHNFDPMWIYCGMTRNEAYQWLADQLGIEKKDCHIGLFDLETCEKVIEICRRKE